MYSLISVKVSTRSILFGMKKYKKKNCTSHAMILKNLQNSIRSRQRTHYFDNEVVIFDSVFHSFCTTFLSDRFFAQIAILSLMFFFCFPCFLDCCLFVFLDGSAYYFDDFMRKVTGFYRLMYGSVNGRPHYVARNCGDPDRYGTNCTYIWYSG